MNITFSGPVFISYAQLWLASGEDEFDLDAAFRGQNNGMIGGGLPGRLALLTGLHTGEIELTVKVCPADPGTATQVLAKWDDIVESSFEPTMPNVALLDWAGESFVNFHLAEKSYRARWSAAGMDDEDQSLPRQTYELCLWPAPAHPDEILRVSSSKAAELHASRQS